MKLPRHAQIYFYFIGALTVLQLLMGANLIVLAAIDAVCLTGLYPLSRDKLDPNNILMFALCLYYGTFSLILKTLVIQPVQQNLVEPMLTSAYLVAGFTMLFLGYLFINRTMLRYYPGTDVRKWTWLERTYGDPRFLERFTLPFTAVLIPISIVIAIFSHSAQEVTNGLATSGGLAVLGSISRLLMLVLAMQLSLFARRGSQSDRTMIIVTMSAGILMTIMNNQKFLAFSVIMTFVIHMIAYRIRLRPAVIAALVLIGTVGFLYVIPLVQIVRANHVEKSERFAETFKLLSEAQYNPFILEKTKEDIDSGVSGDKSAFRMDYLYPNNYGTDRFTQLMPIDWMDRLPGRDPLGFSAYVSDMVITILPKFVVGEHPPDNTADHIAWRYAIRDNNTVTRPQMGYLPTGFGIEGAFGLVVLAPLMVTILFAFVRLIANGSMYQNPFAIFLGGYVFFWAESDMTIIAELIRDHMLNLLIICSVAWLYKLFPSGRPLALGFAGRDH